MLQRMNQDFAYFRDIMGWPPDKRAQRGYRSAIYLYGCGLCTDSASNTDTGGWQSSIYYNGEDWPMVLLSCYPVYCFDPACSYGDRTFQQGAVVLEGMAAALGDQQMRRLITEYRAKHALLDMGQWSGAFSALPDDNFGRSIGAEWQPSWLNPPVWIATPYAQTTNNNGLLTPEYRTTPGWSGSNQIPLRVSGSMVSVNFQPIGANMICVLAYRATDGSCSL